MSITIDSSSRRAVLKIKRLDKLSDFAVERAIFKSGKGLVGTASKQILARPKSGRTYIRRDRIGRRRRHVASAEGESHANMTGTLRKSLGFKVGTRELTFGYGVDRGDAPIYAARINRTRPSLENAIRSEQKNIELHIAREIKKELGGR